MPNNVYIGSRYVPIFDGDWNSTKNYEGLTIVNYQGSSYTSKGPVAAGTLPTNTTYWALTGNYNGQISHLQQQIDDINDEIDDINNTTIPDLSNDITEVEEKSQPKKYKNVVCIGDSWGGTDGWPDKLQAMGFSSGTFQKEAHGGTGFQTGSPTFAQTIAAMTPLVDADKVDCVIIIGGTNDQTNLSALPDAIGNTVKAAKTKFPNAKVYVGFNINLNAGFGKLDATEVNGSSAAISEGGIPLTGLSFNQRYCPSDWLSDNWHLTNYAFFAKMIYSGIYCGTIDVPRVMEPVDLGVSTTIIRSAKAHYENGYGYLTISLNASQTFATLANIVGANAVPLLNLYGRFSKTIKSSTGGDLLDIAGDGGVIDTFLGGTVGNLPCTFTIISHHGNIIGA